MTADGPLSDKFQVRRQDGRDQPGRDRHGAQYFVLDYTFDPFARVALEAYVEACQATHPTLAADLRERLERERL